MHACSPLQELVAGEEKLNTCVTHVVEGVQTGFIFSHWTVSVKCSLNRNRLGWVRLVMIPVTLRYYKGETGRRVRCCVLHGAGHLVGPALGCT